MAKVKLSDIKPNPKNPRKITYQQAEKLLKSIENLPEMMTLRPIIVDESNVILGGNMRYYALKKAGYKDVPAEWVLKASDLTEEKKREFIIKDNASFGEWDWDILANEWSNLPLSDWAVDIPDDWLLPPTEQEIIPACFDDGDAMLVTVRIKISELQKDSFMRSLREIVKKYDTAIIE